MAKKLKNQTGSLGKYAPGIIYDLGAIDPTTGLRTPFYVGETANPEQRLRDHQAAGRTADSESTVVYQTINELNKIGIAWTMETLAHYGEEGPTDLEDEWIMNHLYAGYKLSNMKKGNANWLNEREQAAADMRHRGVRSYRQYRKIIEKEQLEQRHQRWLEEERLRRIETGFQEEIRRQILADQERAQKEVIRQRRLRQEEEKQRQQRQAEAWEAQRPERERRLRETTERLQREELERQQRLRHQEQQAQRQHQLEQDDLTARANLNYSLWPNQEDRIRHQRSEDRERRIMREQGYSDQAIEQYMEKDRHFHWWPGRVA